MFRKERSPTKKESWFSKIKWDPTKKEFIYLKGIQPKIVPYVL
jgi:hypothetical protein